LRVRTGAAKEKVKGKEKLATKKEEKKKERMGSYTHVLSFAAHTPSC